jgi:membrane protease YdiL (CAAX protease family)
MAVPRATSTLVSDTRTTQRVVAPLPLWKALLLFAFASGTVSAGIYFLIPALQSRGLTFLASYLISFYPPFIALFLLALLLYRLEGNVATWAAFKQRYRLAPVHGRTWLWVVGLVVFGLLSTLALSFTARWLASFSWFSPPAFLPSELNPLKAAAPGLFFGTSVHGQWWYALAYLAGWFFNILGEELLWRGYMLPRQEVNYGRWAWFVQGAMWTAMHVFWRWNLLSLVPVTFGIPFVTQRLKNTSVGIIAHGIANCIPLLVLIYYILT